MGKPAPSFLASERMEMRMGSALDKAMDLAIHYRGKAKKYKELYKGTFASNELLRTNLSRWQQDNQNLAKENAELRLRPDDGTAILIRELLGARQVDTPEANLQKLRKILRMFLNKYPNAWVAFDWQEVSQYNGTTPLTHDWSNNAGTPDIVTIHI